MQTQGKKSNNIKMISFQSRDFILIRMKSDFVDDISHAEVKNKEEVRINSRTKLK